ncbi:MAG: exonuclease SbcCD subunit D C-terminal domain-containing protein [Mariprofundus sp.]|nr:exonuclease SbcCD subunit D C-terminal domain-containing protein [Mariprofundus sp.]
MNHYSWLGEVSDKVSDKKRKLKVLHTSDWHIGRTLYGRKRYEEFDAFLNWLFDTIMQQGVDLLLVAGDIFDTSTPSNRAQALYYRFLCRVATSSCRHVVVIAGNHDSPSFLNAPKELLKSLDVHVVGDMSIGIDEELLLLTDQHGEPDCLVCATPYLRDRDIRMVEAGESIDDKERKIIEGIQQHYVQVVALAEQKRSDLALDIPLIVMGHLFTAGGQTIDGDGVRELYVGSLAHVTGSIFPENLDYLALGHLHVPQKVGGSEVMRYSGSPIAMGFGEAKQTKSVCLVEFTGRHAEVCLINVPCFQQLEQIKGDAQQLEARMLELSVSQTVIWLEILYEGDELIGELRAALDAIIEGTQLEILRVKNKRVADKVLNQMHQDETLADLDVDDVFERCLIAHDVPEQQRPELLSAYKESLAALYEDDCRAE